MVKGTTRRVVVLKSPDPHIFDEAIFIVKDDAFHRGVTSSEILREAQATVDSFLDCQEGEKKNLLSRIPPQVFALLGAGATGLLWLITSLF